MKKRSKTSLREAETAARNRREIIAAQLTRRDLMKMGLLTGAGYLIPKHGLSARPKKSDGGHDNTPVSPPTRSFIEPLAIMPVAQPVSSLSPAPTVCPNTAAGEGRTRCHQALAQFPPQKLYEVTQESALVSMSADLPLQTLWTFNGITPGATYHANYGEPILVRNFNNLPTSNGGFGKPSVTTHLHNGHTPSESDGDPCDFFEIGHFYDQHYPNILAGSLSDHQPGGDINESLSTLWYHDHRVDFTSQNVYKGLFGFYLLFNQLDSGYETTGFRLPSGNFDVPMVFSDKVFDSNSGLLAFDLFNLDGILGDKFLVNGKIQPFFQVHPRWYRFRWLDGGPSRFYQFYLTDLHNLGATNTYWVIANDGNLLPTPVQVQSVRIAPAERVDVIIDFSKFAGRTIYLENRLTQLNGQGPVDDFGPNATSQECSANLGTTVSSIRAAGQGDLLLQFRVAGGRVEDDSVDPASHPKFYSLPSTTAAPRVVRTFKFDRL